MIRPFSLCKVYYKLYIKYNFNITTKDFIYYIAFRFLSASKGSGGAGAEPLHNYIFSLIKSHLFRTGNTIPT